MKLQKKIWMQAMMLGLGATLLMAGSARAQQEVDPTYFDINPGTPAISKAAPVRLAVASSVKTEGQTQNALALATSKEGTLEAGVMRMAIVDVSVALILACGILSIVAYALVATRRERSRRPSRASASYYPVSAATAQ
jgi:hypothetical protein